MSNLCACPVIAVIGPNLCACPVIAGPVIAGREKDPEYIKALMGANVMTIPARIEDGKTARQEEAGQVFSVSEKGDLHMRYTIRTNNVIWSEEPKTAEALAYLREILNSDSPHIFKGLLEPGMGLISNNVLHDRAVFSDDAEYKRHYYRARYFDRLVGTGLSAS